MSAAIDEDLQAATRWQLGRAEQAREDPVKFYDFVMREERTGRSLRIAPHQKVLIEFIQAHKRCVVRAPVGFGKSYITAALTLYKLGHNPSERGANISSTVTAAQKPVGMVRRYIEESAELRLVFPHLRRSGRRGEPWTQTKITVARDVIMRDPSLVAVGDNGKIPGSRLSWVIPDDLLNMDNTLDEAQRLRVRNWLGTSVLDRFDPDGGHCPFINTPWFPDDLTFQLEKSPDKGGLGWASITMDAHGDIVIRNTEWDSDDIRPAMTDDPERVRHRLVAHDDPAYARMSGVQIPRNLVSWIDEHDAVPLWPEVFGWDVLNAKTNPDKAGGMAMTPIEYARAYRCRVRDNATAAVKIEWIELCKANARKAGVRLVEQWDGAFPAFTGVDPAFGQGARHDKTAIFTFAVLPGGVKRILDVQIGRWAGGEVVTRILKTAERFNSIVCVEGNAAQGLIRQWAQERNVSAPVRTMNTGRNKMDPRFGVQSLFIEIENGAWLIPNDDRGHCSPMVQELVSSLLEYDADRHTADVIMAMWIAREYARRIGALRGDPPGGKGLSGIGAR